MEQKVEIAQTTVFSLRKMFFTKARIAVFAYILLLKALLKFTIKSWTSTDYSVQPEKDVLTKTRIAVFAFILLLKAFLKFGTKSWDSTDYSV